MKILKKNKIIIIVSISILLIGCFVCERIINNDSGKEEVILYNEENEVKNDCDNQTHEDVFNSDVGEGSNDNENSSAIENDSTNESFEVQNNNIDEVSSLNDNKNKIYIYITGEVNNSGVVILNEGSRIVDAINAAGGTTGQADISKINLVFLLSDGMKVSIPNSEELRENPNYTYVTLESGNGADDASWNSDSANVNNYDSGLLQNSSNYTSRKININSASQTELETLPGIGPSIALRIINYRNENGNFSSIEQIKNVSGVGDAKFDEIKQLITV